MSQGVKSFKARCLCGAANHDITLKTSDFPLKAYICHCNSCRHALGTMYAAVAFLSKDYEPDQAVLDKLTTFHFSPRLDYHFCTTCGCQMMARARDQDGTINWALMTGTLDRVEDIVKWVAHEHIEDTLDSGFSDFLISVGDEPLPRWPGTLNAGEQLPPYWTSPSRPEPKFAADDKLHGCCKCGGVEFWLSRPTKAMAKDLPPIRSPERSSENFLPQNDDSIYLRDQGRKYLAGHCVCNSCRLACGVEVTSWAFVPTANISLDRDGKTPWSSDFGTLKRHQSSPGCYRHFCGTCGAIVFYNAEGREWLQDIAIGLLDAPGGAKAESWFGWRTRRLGYRDDAIPRAESFVLGIEEALRSWEQKRGGEDMSGSSQSAGAL